MPVGYLVTVLVLGLCVVLLLPRVRGPRLLNRASFWTGMVVNEQAHWMLALLSGAGGASVRLQIDLSIDEATGSVSGTVQAQPGPGGGGME